MSELVEQALKPRPRILYLFRNLLFTGYAGQLAYCFSENVAECERGGPGTVGLAHEPKLKFF